MCDCALDLLFTTERDAAFSESFGKVKVRRTKNEFNKIVSTATVFVACLDKILVPLFRQQHNYEHKVITERLREESLEKWK
ncbi:unnamed protein product [Rhizophagus irregularis]|nr:unnamed protein product [Rhizophagus irregularis]